MPTLSLKPTHKPVKTYYAALDQFAKLGVTHETAVRAAFQGLLENCARQCKWTLVPEYGVSTGRGKRTVVDGALVDDFRLTHGYWEAKDIHDDLPAEVDRKLKAGYPTDNILFQTPRRAMLWQNGRLVLDSDLTDATQLIDTLQMFFGYRPAGVCRVGGGRRPVQGQSSGHRPGLGQADPAGAEKQPHLHRRVRRVSGQMPAIDQPESIGGSSRGDADPAPVD